MALVVVAVVVVLLWFSVVCLQVRLKMLLFHYVFVICFHCVYNNNDDNNSD